MSTDNNETNETSVESNEVEGQELETTQENNTKDKTTETEAKTFDEAYVKKLRDEAAEKRTALKTANEALESMKQQFEKAQETINNLKGQMMNNTRKLIASQHGLSDELAERLQGSTEEELLADAQKLKKLVGGINVGQEGSPITDKPSSQSNYYLNLARKQ